MGAICDCLKEKVFQEFLSNMFSNISFPIGWKFSKVTLVFKKGSLMLGIIGLFNLCGFENI